MPSAVWGRPRQVGREAGPGTRPRCGGRRRPRPRHSDQALRGARQQLVGGVVAEAAVDEPEALEVDGIKRDAQPRRAPGRTPPRAAGPERLPSWSRSTGRPRRRRRSRGQRMPRAGEAGEPRHDGGPSRVTATSEAPAPVAAAAMMRVGARAALLVGFLQCPPGACALTRADVGGISEHRRARALPSARPSRRSPRQDRFIAMMRWFDRRDDRGSATASTIAAFEPKLCQGRPRPASLPTGILPTPGNPSLLGPFLPDTGEASARRATVRDTGFPVAMFPPLRRTTKLTQACPRTATGFATSPPFRCCSTFGDWRASLSCLLLQRASTHLDRSRSSPVHLARPTRRCPATSRSRSASGHCTSHTRSPVMRS